MMKKKTAAKVGLASLAVMLGGGTILMNTQAYTPVHAETQNENDVETKAGETVQKSVILMVVVCECRYGRQRAVGKAV